jgi:hypothetical protein
LKPGADPTIASYNASVAKIYNAASSLVRFEAQKCFLLHWKNALAYYNAGVGVVNVEVEVVNVEVVGLAPVPKQILCSKPNQGDQIGRIFAYWVIVYQLWVIFRKL